MSGEKTIMLYHVEYALKLGDRWDPHIAVLRDPGEAEKAAQARRGDKNYRCIRVTGPHPHQVPA